MADPNGSRTTTRRSQRLDAARAAHNTWYEREFGGLGGKSIAYFSAEFALHQSLPIYAGGLGVLAGDHCKEASDLGVPLVGVGFMYPQGYFHQSVSADGWQEEIYEKLNWTDTAIEPAMTPDGKPCVTAVPLGNRTVLVAVWRVRIGRVSLFLLDTGLEENAPWDRDLSARLYGGDRETRVQQEIVLGIGGVRALKALGIEPAVFHLNEGHAAFAVLQRIRDLCERGASFEAALDEVRRTTVFTTHTPVAAGHDAFPFQLVETHLSGAWGDLGDYREKFFGLAHYDSGGGPLFNMTALAMRTAGAVNGVSQLHGQVTRQMWQPIWPDTPADRLPVRSLTNGVHVPTWMSAEIADAPRTAPRPRLDGASRRPGVLRRGAADSGRGAVGGAAVAARVPVQFHPRARTPALDDRGYCRTADRRRRHDVRSQHADDRLRAAFHRLQAARADLHGRRSPGRHPQPAGARGAARVRGQGASGRRRRQASPAADLSPRARPEIRRADRLRRGLRPARRALPGAGLRRLDEQPAQAARGQRHERHEGGDQRHAAHVDRRRLVGRGLYRRQRLADRRAGRSERSRRAGLGRRPGALRADRAAARARLLRPRRPGDPAPLAPGGQAVDPHRASALQHAAHGQGVRAGDVRAGARSSRSRNRPPANTTVTSEITFVPS